MEEAAMHALLNGGANEVIAGPMFSGKTEELIRRLRRCEIAGIRVLLVKPTKDTRTDEKTVESRCGMKLDAVSIRDSSELLKLARDFQVVGSDEAHFNDFRYPEVVMELARQGTRVISATLDLNFRGVPFSPMVSDLITRAYPLTKLAAVCKVCGSNHAIFSQRLVDCQDLELVGDGEYEARCIKCFKPPSVS